MEQPAPGLSLADRSLILASASPRRRELVAFLGLPFEVVPSEYEEESPAEHPHPEEFAVHLASGKAIDVAEKYPEALVIGADTIVTLEGRLYSKPTDDADAIRILTELSGRTHQVITGVTVTFLHEGERWLHSLAAVTDVTFRPLAPAEIEAYVATGEGRDKAGAYGIQQLGSLLIEGIAGDYPNVVGLPITPLAMLLRSLGIPVLGLPR